MLLFVCEPKNPGTGARAHRRLEDALSACGEEGRVLVVDGRRLVAADDDPERLRLDSPGAVLNVGPAGDYLPPEAVVAAGGYVVRRGPAGPELLLIYRRGAWDLPKGKLDPDESPEAGALREVSEEIGVPQNALRVLGPLGTTVHGYPHPRRPTYAVKTTHWYSLATTATTFSPQSDEGIESVEWLPWDDAGARLDFGSLREHHAGLDQADLGL